MNEFIEKTIDKAEEKIKVTSLEIIVTGAKDKPYFEIKYKEVGKEDYNIGYSSYDLNNVFGWKEDCFEIVKELAEEYNNDFCEWRYDEFEEKWQTDCGVLFALHDSDREITHFCPYCGNEIKVVE